MIGEVGQPMVWLLPAVPLLAAAVGAVLAIAGSRSRRAAAAVAVTGAAAVVAVAIPVATGAVGLRTATEGSVAIAPTGGSLTVHAATLLDPLAGIIAVMVSLVALAVQLYSVEYLRHDGRYPTFAAEVSLFTAAMLAVVVGGDLVSWLIGWEVMGLCSYLLIGHYRDLPEAPGAALKAFLVTRVGDVGFLVGVLLLGLHAHTFAITGVIAAVPQLSPAVLTTATLLISAGVAGKSAQFPLHTWLPDAMAGPTPISALIHAATMVAAGIYVVLRLHPVFAAAPVTLAVLAVVAAVTMILGGLAALGQDDIKRVLAWSTVSQLAYMLGAAAVGAVTASAFHLLTHAAFKALLFLAAGAVLHAAGTGSMSRLGGLRHRMPVTFGVTVVGALALAGIPPAAGAFSKESVLDAAYAAARGEVAGVAPWSGWLVLLAGLATVLLTAAYLTRMLLRTFFGTPRDAAAASAAHEPGWWMRLPLLALVIPAAGLGVLEAALPEWLGGHLHLDLAMSAVSLLLAAAGAGLVYRGWRGDPAADPLRALPARLRAAFAAGLYVDTAQRALVVRPVLAVARLAATTDRDVVDGVVRGAGREPVRLGRLLARAHRPDVQRYATGLLVGSLLIAVAVVVAR